MERDYREQRFINPRSPPVSSPPAKLAPPVGQHRNRYRSKPMRPLRSDRPMSPIGPSGPLPVPAHLTRNKDQPLRRRASRKFSINHQRLLQAQRGPAKDGSGNPEWRSAKG